MTLTLKENVARINGKKSLSVIKDGEYTTVHIYFEDRPNADEDEKLIEDVFKSYNRVKQAIKNIQEEADRNPDDYYLSYGGGLERAIELLEGEPET